MKLVVTRFLGVVLTLPFLVQCGNLLLNPGDNRNGSNPDDAKLHFPYDPNWNGALRAIVVPEKEANKYLVQLQWKPKSKASSLTLSRMDNSTGRTTEVKQLPSDSNYWIDSQIDSGKTYEYFLKSDSDSEQVSVVVPVDLEYRGLVLIKDTQTANRLFLREGAKLLIEDRNVKITVSEINSENGMITTFTPDSRAGLNLDGRNGGYLTLTANQLNGKLAVVMHGENGGQGLPGNNGAKGAKGQSGSVSASYVCDKPWVGLGGPTPEREAQCRQSVANGADPKKLYSCVTHPTNGYQGSPGGPGSNGGVGRNGGNSGKALVTIKNAAREDLLINFIAGEAGPGGAAGKGGPGGDGGDPGADPYGVCPATPGPQGANGAEGVQGLPGQTGRVE